MNKQEAIDKIKNIGTLKINDTVLHQQIDMVIKNQVLDIISQIHEPKKPVIPQFVADWIKYCKSTKLTFLGAFHPVSEHGIRFADTLTEEIWEGIDWAKRNQETFARAWLDGYEVEKKKLYTVEIPNPNSAGGKTILFKQKSTNLVIMAMLDENINKPEYLWLTEQEIRKDFEWAWQFAKEVEDDTKI
ncbi:hypothetical protein Si088_00739 [Streptococcus infantarius subsp. infantarius]|nr:hypothetical protein [Streptococcus infantarius subsp. infantarius]